jgi:predicted ATPase
MESEEILRIREQHLNGQWPQFLESVEISGLRGWTGQVVEFKFPIVAIVGENGTGKSTVLKVAACAYKNESGASYYPSTFFMETQWDHIHNVSLNYRIRQGSTVSSYKYSKPSQRWGYPEKQFRRSVFIYDVSRTLPLDATAGYAKIAKQASNEVSSTELNEEYRKGLSRVLGREYIKARFAATDVNKSHEVGLLTRDFGEISQFHQGAGEDATLDLFKALQQIPNYSLLIIDEVEASLHPKAQRRLIEFLLWYCRQKRVQIILSTHSPYILEQLPREARVLLLPGQSVLNIVHGISPEFAMSYIDENAHPELHVFMEDREAVTLLREIIVSHPDGPELLHRIDTQYVGPANVVQMLGKLGTINRLPYKSMGFLDGDIEESEGCVKLPGSTAPERVIFNDLKARNWPNLPERFGIGAGELFRYFEDAMLNVDHHAWTTEIGNHVKMSSNGVWQILCREWCNSCLSIDEKNRVIGKINDALS